MTTKDKILLHDSFFDINLSDDVFSILKRFAYNRNALVRSMVPEYLLDFDNSESERLLLKLSDDKNALVRTEAYDSLGSFPSDDVEEKLRNAIISESDALAACYAIESWADVVVALNDVTADNIVFAEARMADETNDRLILGWCYALYRFGDVSYLNKVMSFLENGDYHIRCYALNLLDEVLDDSNRKTIQNAVADLLKTETAGAVVAGAEKLMNKLTIGE